MSGIISHDDNTINGNIENTADVESVAVRTGGKKPTPESSLAYSSRDRDDIDVTSGKSKDYSSQDRHDRHHFRHHHHRRKSDSRHGDKKKSHKKRRRREEYSDSSDDKSEFESSSDATETSSSADDDEYRRKRQDRKERKQKHETKKNKKSDDRRHEKKDKKKKHKKGRSDDHQPASAKTASATPTFGQYGIIKASDMTKMQRSFDVWLSEVHGVHLSASNIPRYELQQYFDTYREDYNTATLPHIKYYNYDKWELEEHEKQKREVEQLGQNSNAIINDERNHAIELQRIAKRKDEAALQFVAATMNTTKVKEMQHQKQLQTQMQMAFKMGDHETYRKIKEKLQPPDK
jgi:hypothetical protein